MTPRRWLLAALAAAAVLLLAGRALARTYVDFQWFAAMGAADIWRDRTLALVLLRAVSGAAATAFVFLNLYAVRRSVVSLVLPRRVANLEIGEEVPGSYLLVAVVVLSLILGSLLSLPQDDWIQLVAARHGTEFGETDPYFGRDLGFFVYWLPFEVTVHTWTLISILIVTAMVLFLYALTPSLRWDRGTLYVSAYVRRHVTILAGVLLLMLAWSYRIDMYELLLDGSGPEGAFTRIDHTVAIPANLILALVTLGAALVVVWAGWSGQLRMAGGTIVAVVLLSVAAREGAPWLARRGVEDAAVQERPYEATRAGYTRRGFGVDQIVNADSGAAYASLGAAARSISVWDPAALAHADEGARPVDVAPSEIGWRATPAGLVAVLPERPVRTVDQEPAQWKLTRALAWAADEHGALMRVDAAGSPTLDETTLGTPLVFEGAEGYRILTDSARRTPGPRLATWRDRLAHAWSFQRPGLLLDEPPASSVVVMRRDVRARLRDIAPFFAQGSVLSPLVSGDTLTWIVDLYSASGYYPLSRSQLVAGDRRSYFHHAATALVNATTGSVSIVADSVLDPIATTWVERYPALFTRLGALPPAVRHALPPAIDGVRAQATAFGRYGSRADSDVPKRRPLAEGADEQVVAATEIPYLTPNGGALAVAIPLVTDSTERIRGAFLGLGGEDRRAVWLPFPADSGRWGVAIDRLRALDAPGPQREAGTVHGTAHVVPVAGRAALVQSSYVWRTAGGATLARVAVAWADSARAAPTLAQLLGGTLEGPPLPPPAPGGDFHEQVETLYRTMREAMQRGDWAAFGRAFDALGRLLPERRR